MATKGSKRGEAWRQRKAQILDFIKRYYQDKRMSPATWEIAEAVYNTRNAGNIGRLLNQLEDEGFLYRIPHVSRSIILTVPQPRDTYLEDDKQ